MLRKDILKALKHDASTASPEEIARFSLLAQEWWNPHGAFKVVHSVNQHSIGTPDLHPRGTPLGLGGTTALTPA